MEYEKGININDGNVGFKINKQVGNGIFLIPIHHELPVWIWWWWSGSCWRAISTPRITPSPPLFDFHSPMASSGLPSRTFHHHRLPSSAPSHPSRETCVPCCLPGVVSRRRAAVQLLSAGFLTAVSPPPPSLAARRGRIVVPPEDYVTARTSVCLLPCALV